jgi:hypothetical protein
MARTVAQKSYKKTCQVSVGRNLAGLNAQQVHACAEDQQSGQIANACPDRDV